MGSEEATTLMEHLPPVGWADVATKRDLDQLALVTQRDLDQFAAAMKAEIDQLTAVTKSEFARVEERIGAVEHRVLARLQSELLSHTRTMIFSMATMVLTVAGLAFGAARLV